MADQVNLSVSLAPAPSLTTAVIARSQPVQEKPQPVRSADPQAAELVDGRPAPPAEALGPAVQELREHLQQRQADLEFQVDKSTGRTIFKVVDAKTQEVLRQVPTEDILAMAQKLRELTHSKSASGVLVDEEG